jgi:lipopolysaccharide biosynthesis regulator YciM
VRRLRRLAGGRGERDLAYRRALLCVLDHDLERAEAWLAELVRADSDQVDAYLALGRIYRQRGEIGRAIRIHQNLLLRRDLDAERRREALAGLASDFQAGGFLRRAIAAWEEVAAASPEHEAALRALVRLLADVRDFPRALALQRRLERRTGAPRGPARAALRVELAAALRAEGRADEARRALRQALREDPACAEAWIRLGELEAERGRPRRALDAWRRVPALDRRAGARVYPLLAASCAALSRGAEHERWLRQRLEAVPDDAEARLALARALASRGEVEEAGAELRRVLERDPEHLEAHAARARLALARPGGPELGKAVAELLDALERAGWLRERERAS